MKSMDISEAPDLVPRPDPTKLTTEALLREIAALREIIETRIEGVDARFAQLHAEFDRRPAEIKAAIAEAINGLQKLHDEKFRSIQTQFAERDTRTEQNARDTKVAVDAALQAAEKAVGKQQETFGLATSKSEAATTKQIDQMGILVSTTTQGLRDMIDDVKQRLTRIEGRGEGSESSSTTHRSTSNLMVSLIAMLIGLAGLVFGIIMAVRR